MLDYICDKCGKRGYINPTFKAKKKMTEFEVPTPDPENPGEVIIKKVSYEMPETKEVKKQNPLTGKIEKHQEAVVEFLQERIIRIHLELGPNERICREFCGGCFSGIKSQIKSTWDLLEGIEPI